jgi:hypothetical protein
VTRRSARTELGKRPLSVEQLPEPVQRAIDVPAWRPKPADVPLLAEKDEMFLIEQFHAISGWTNRTAIALVLGYGGGQKSVTALIRALTNEYDTRQLSEAETADFLALLQALGYASRRNEAAYRFLGWRYLDPSTRSSFSKVSVLERCRTGLLNTAAQSPMRSFVSACWSGMEPSSSRVTFSPVSIRL